jgi:hypothetical protein
LRRSVVGPRDDPTDQPRIPADPGLNKQVVLVFAVSADLAEGDAKTFGTGAGGFCQDVLHICFDKGEGAEFRERLLLPQEACDIFVSACTSRCCRAVGPFQYGKPWGKRRRRLAGADDLLDDLKGVDNVLRTVRLTNERVAIGLCQIDPVCVARCIENAHAACVLQPGGNFRAAASLGQLDIKDRKVRPLTIAEFDRRGDRAGDTAHVVPAVDKDVLEHIRHEEVILGDHD